MIGQTISHYKVQEKLGEGGMGAVYLAEDTSLDRKVALKFLPSHLQDDEIAHRRFLREAKSAAALDHPFICNIHEVGQTDDGQDFICMELVEGQTLREKLAEGHLPLPDALRIGTEISEALEEAHRNHIVHRDLKPANVMLTRDGHAKVLDFGLAKRIAQEDGREQDISSALTLEGSTLGTLTYMSPEQVKAQSVDHRSDIFSFGVVLYEMLTGVHPFRKANPTETAAAIIQTEPAAVGRYVDGVPELLQRTVTKMLAKNPDDRYQSVHEVRTNLRELSGELTRPSDVVITVKGRPAWIRVGMGIVGLILIAVLGYWGWNALTQTGSPSEQDRKSIAVLPLDNLSSEPESDYFSDGLTEDIIAQLSKIDELKVISRTSVMLYKDTDRNLRQIGQELGVVTILEGSVRRADGRVRVVAQLIDTKTDEHLWAETYDRELKDIFAIQSDVAEQIAGALKAELSPEAKVQIQQKPTESLEAYNLYQQGRFFRFFLTESRENIQKAADHFRQATEEDPNFALAYAALAECYYHLAQIGHAPLEKAERALEQAFKLDDTLPDAYVVRGQIQEGHHYDWEGAEEAFKRAIELNPNHWNAHRQYGWFLARMGRYEAALVERKQVHQLDPVARFSNNNLAQSYQLMGDFDQVIEINQKMVELYPEQDRWRHEIAVAYAEKGLFDEALEELKKVKPPNRNSRGYLSAAGYIHALMGNRAEAQKYVERLESLELPVYRKNRPIAQIFVGLRDYEEALKRLEQALVGGGSNFPNLKTWYWTAPLRDDPRYIQLLRRTNLEP